MRVILFDIDTLRADHMGCYGYGRNTTPVMDSIAREGCDSMIITARMRRACRPVRP